MLSTSDQAYVFLSTVYAGFIIGFFYDCCRIIRKMIRAGVLLPEYWIFVLVRHRCAFLSNHILCK